MGGMSKAGGAGVGIGQTWQDVAGLRANNTPYLNASGRPIEVAVAALNVGSGAHVGLKLSPDNVSYIDVPSDSVGMASNQAAACCVVPHGWYYKTVMSGSIVGWAELR
jgi:hypothetical protein